MLKFIIYSIILIILFKLLLKVLNNLLDAIEKNQTQKIRQQRDKEYEEFKQQLDKEQEEFEKINYATLYKGANTLKGNCYKFFAKISRIEGENIFYADMLKYYYRQ